MALIPVLSADPRVADLVSRTTPPRFSVARASSWDRLFWLVRERPAAAVVLDGAGLPKDPEADDGVADLRRRFPGVGCVLLSRTGIDRRTLLRLGRAAIRNLELVRIDELDRELARAIARSCPGAARTQVMRSVGARLPRREREVVRAAMDGALLGWKAPELAAFAGLTPQHLGVRLKARGLPSTGHLLVWAKVLHAAQWLDEPGRSAESVSRQLGYSNGGVFRRTLRNYLGVTPAQLREQGGLGFAIGRFLDACGLGDSVRAVLSVA